MPITQTPQSTRKPLLYAAATLSAAMLLAVFWVGSRHGVGWNHLVAWAFKTQNQLHHGLTAALHSIAQHGPQAAWPLIGLSFAYGVFHAAGPGHGKAVMSTYLGTSTVRMRRGLMLSTLAALMQGVVAVVLVETVVGVLGYSLRQGERVGSQLENASFILVALVGAILMLRSGWTLIQRRQHAGHSHAPDNHCAHCEQLQHLASGAARVRSWQTELVTVAAIGIRPCTGAVLILIAAHALTLRWAGIAAVLAMSAGTAITVGALAAGVVGLRRSMLGGNRLKSASVVLEIAGVLGGGALFLLGLSLVQFGMQAPTHPLF